MDGAIWHWESDAGPRRLRTDLSSFVCATQPIKILRGPLIGKVKAGGVFASVLGTPRNAAKYTLQKRAGGRYTCRLRDMQRPKEQSK